MKFGVTQPFACSYLPDRQEQLLVYIPEDEAHAKNYSSLIQSGFRRSGNQVYRPHCAQCNKCESIRVLASQFTLSKSQKRILNKNTDISCKMVEHGSDYFLTQRDNYFALYSDYITQRHQDGSMYPPQEKQFTDFIHSQWQSPLLLEAKIGDDVVAVAVTDKTESGFSAFYTFFNPHLASRSLGTYMILKQIEFCQTFNLPYLYLGYQIDECRKMNYKSAFAPNQRFNGEFWV